MLSASGGKVNLISTTSIVTFYAIAASLAVGALYVLVWRLPFYQPLRSKASQMMIGGAAAIALVCLFAWAQAKLLLWPFSHPALDLTFSRSDIWPLSLAGFFEGLFCLLPLLSWFDEATHNNPVFQKKNTKALLLSSLFLVVFPHYLALHAYTTFHPDRIEYVSYWNPAAKEMSYEDVTELRIDSETRTSRGKAGTRKYSVVLLELHRKNQEKFLLLETEDPTEVLARKTAALVRLLEEKKIRVTIPTVLIGHGEWKTRLESYLEKNY